MEMQSKMFLTFGCALLFVLSKSPPCWAQAEPDPDHFGTLANEAAGTFQGSFALMHEVNCAGMTLTPGAYSLLIRPVGAWNVVTLTPKGSGDSVQVRVKAPSSAGPPAALMLERTSQQSILTAIRLQKPGTMLYFQPQNRNASADIEVVPVSYEAPR